MKSKIGMLSAWSPPVREWDGIYLAAFFFFFFFFWGGLLNHNRFLNLGLLLDSDEQADDFLGLHVVLINVELSEDIVNLSLGHLVSPGLQSVLEHLGVDLAVVVVGLESLDDQVIGVSAIASHLLGEHGDHVVGGAGSGDLTKEAIQLTLGHQDTDVVEGSAEVIFVEDAILVDVHQFEAILVHGDPVLGEPSLILALSHFARMFLSLEPLIVDSPCTLRSM